MTELGARRLAKGSFGVVIALAVVSLVFHELARRNGAGGALFGDVAYLVVFSLFPIVGVILALRRPRNALGWLMLVIGLFAVEPTSAVGDYLLASGRPGGAWALAVLQWSWVPVIGLSGTFVLLLFPDGHLPSARWRWFAWTAAIGLVITSIVIFLTPGRLGDLGHPELRNPYALTSLEPILTYLSVGLFTIPVGIIGAALSLVIRSRRSGSTERLQIRWLASAAVIVASLYAVAMVASLATGSNWDSDGGWVVIVQNAAVLSFALVPISIGIAVLRYRLYDINVVIRKALVVAALAVFFSAVYAAVVGGIGASVSGSGTPALSFAAAALVAILFQPVLARARRIADRLVYGKRATPYEVLAEFSERVAETYADDDVLPRMARVVGEGVGATHADVWLRFGDELRPAASWPADPERPVAVRLGEDGRVPRLPGADAAFPVEHQGTLLGALAVATPANDPMDEAKAKLVADLAGQAGLVLRNVRLTEDLRARLGDLKAAQKRLVAAQDEERRRLERNIHDGAQQQLVALAVQLRLAQSLVGKDPAKAETMLSELQTRTIEALEDLRDLARGIYPPLLADQGLAAALEAQARKSIVPVAISPDGIGRYPQQIEAAAYFCVLEALQNVAKYAAASSVGVRLGTSDGHLEFEIRDDGRGFDPSVTGYGTGLQGMADRLAALDGTLEVRSTPGSGTVVLGRVPVKEPVA